MFITQKSEFKHPLKTCAFGLAVMSLVFSTTGFCEQKPDHEAKAKQLLRQAVEMPMPKESDQLGPHPSDSKNYAKFKAEKEKVVARERAQEEAYAEPKNRIRALQ